MGVFLFDMWGILFVAGDDVTEDGFEGVYCFACGEVGEQSLGFLAQALHGAECVVDAPSIFGKLHQLVDFLVVEFLLVRQLVHFLALRQFLSAKGVDERQGDFSLAQIVACGLSYYWVVEIVEGVVLDLETLT